jgi:hypothetical protein
LTIGRLKNYDQWVYLNLSEAAPARGKGETILKICKTCSHWSYENKGICHRENRGVGQFWHCEEWLQNISLEENGKNAPEHSCALLLCSKLTKSMK